VTKHVELVELLSVKEWDFDGNLCAKLRGNRGKPRRRVAPGHVYLSSTMHIGCVVDWEL